MAMLEKRYYRPCGLSLKSGDGGPRCDRSFWAMPKSVRNCKDDAVWERHHSGKIAGNGLTGTGRFRETPFDDVRQIVTTT